jgi:uncharacterized OsmC-like protein
MKNTTSQKTFWVLIALTFLLALFMSACQTLAPSQEVQAESLAAAEESAPQVEVEAQDSDADDEKDKDKDKDKDKSPKLATAMASAKLTNQPGRAIVSARGNHFIVDSVPPIEGPNEELNPLDMMLGAQATCALFIAEHVAQEEGIPLEDVLVGVEGDLDPSGLAGSGADPRIQKMRVHLELPGADEAQTALIIKNFKLRCPVYTTLSRATDIEIAVGDETPSPPSDGLATAKVSAQLSNQPGRAIVSARGNHFVIDSVPPLDGPNEERNPLDLMLGALATCGTFLFERSAQELNIPITEITTFVEGDLDPRGLASKDGSINPRLQVFRVNIVAKGITDEEASEMNEQYQQRCPIYTTLQRAAPIDVTVSTN